jgi:hypothetical protein
MAAVEAVTMPQRMMLMERTLWTGNFWRRIP